MYISTSIQRMPKCYLIVRIKNADCPLSYSRVKLKKLQQWNLSFPQHCFSPVGRFEDLKPANQLNIPEELIRAVRAGMCICLYYGVVREKKKNWKHCIRPKPYNVYPSPYIMLVCCGEQNCLLLCVIIPGFLHCTMKTVQSSSFSCISYNCLTTVTVAVLHSFWRLLYILPLYVVTHTALKMFHFLN